MVEFKQTLLAHVLAVPFSLWTTNCFYIFLLHIPLIVVAYTIGLVFAVIVDAIVFSSDGYRGSF